jgi:hypothetical protein
LISKLVIHKLKRFLSKSKHIELLWFVHIMHHNSLLCIATKKSRFIRYSHMNMFSTLILNTIGSHYCTLVPNTIGSHYTSMLFDVHIWDTLRSPKHLTKWGVHVLGCPHWPLSFIKHDCQWHQYFNTILLDLCARGCPSFRSHNLHPTFKCQHYFHYAYELEHIFSLVGMCSNLFMKEKIKVQKQ